MVDPLHRRFRVVEKDTVDFTVRQFFPYPVAVAWHRVLVAGPDINRIKAVLDVHDVLLRTLVCMLLPDYLRGDLDPAVEKALEHLKRPAMGHWVGMVREILGALQRRGSPEPFIPEAISWYFDDRGSLTAEAKQFEAFVTQRNQYAHGVHSSGNLATREMAIARVDTARKILQGVDWLKGYRILRATEQAPVRGGGTEGRLQFFAGTERQPMPRSKNWHARVLPESLYLTNPSGNAVLEVSPLIQVLLDRGTNQDRLFLLKNIHRNGRLVMVDDSTGIELTEPLETKDGRVRFGEWLDKRDTWQPWQENRDAQGRSQLAWSADEALAGFEGTIPPRVMQGSDEDSDEAEPRPAASAPPTKPKPVEPPATAARPPETVASGGERRGRGRTMAIVAVVVVGLALAAAFAIRSMLGDSGDGETRVADVPAGPVEGAPVPGGTLVIGGSKDVGSLLPVVPAASHLGYHIVEFMYPRLVHYGFNWEVAAKPGLAERWTFGEDGRSITLHLRDDVRWTDGNALDADDVAFTLELIRDPAVGSQLQPYLQHLQADGGIEVVDEHTVTLRFTRANDSVTMLAHVAAMPIAPQHLLHGWPRDQLQDFPLSETPVSAGLFTLARWDPGEELVLARNDAANITHTAYLDQVTVRFIEGYEERIAALEAGQIDLMTDIRVEDVARQKQQHPRIRHVELDRRSVDLVGWNLRQERFADVRVRRALAHAIDTGAIIEQVFTAGKKAYAARAVGTITPDLPAAHNFAIEPLAHDLERARALFAEAGWVDTDGDGWLDRDGVQFVFRLDAPDTKPHLARVLDLIAAQLAEVGIRANTAVLPPGEFYPSLGAGTFDAALLGIKADLIVDPTRFWFTNGGQFNVYPYSNDKVDALISQGLAATDRAEADQCWRDMQALIHDDQPCCFLYWRQRILAIDSRFEDVAADTISPFTDLEDWWVPEDRRKHPSR